MAADVAQRGSSRIKSYASAFSNILINNYFLLKKEQSLATILFNISLLGVNFDKSTIFKFSFNKKTNCQSTSYGSATKNYKMQTQNHDAMPYIKNMHPSFVGTKLYLVNAIKIFTKK